MIEFLYTGNYNHLGEIDRIFQGGRLGFAMTMRITADFDCTVSLGYVSRLVTSPATLGDQQNQQIDGWQAQIRQEFPLRSDGNSVIIEQGETSVWNWAISHPLPDYGMGGENRGPLPGTVSGGWRDRWDLFRDPIAAGLYAYEGIWETRFFVYLRWSADARLLIRDYALSDPITHLVDYYGFGR